MSERPNNETQDTEIDNDLPQFAKNVIVPVANPKTAAPMLELAVTLADDENGRVIAVIVADGEANEKIAELEDQLEPLIATMNEAGHNIELQTQIASNVTRGILDAVREYDADMLIMGVQRHDRRQVKLGSVVHNVLDAATCDVLIYRLGDEHNYHRVVATYNGSLSATNAVNTGVLIAKAHDAHFVPLYLQRDYVFRADNERRCQQAYNMLSAGAVEKEIIPGHDPASRILRLLDADDLLVMGFWHKNDNDIEIENDLTRTLLNRSPGPVLLVSRVVRERNLRGVLSRRLQRFNLMLTPVERDELVWQAQKTALATIDYSVMIMLSALLASFGLLLNSVAVIIGAMLVAPLMQPLAAFSTGLVTGMLPITRRAASTLIQGAILALVISIIGGLIVPTKIATPEMLARGNPSLLDAAIALASGLVAGFATARKEIPVALAGVAIAAALMPPISTVGLSIAFGNWPLAAGSGLLFVTNIAFIILAEALVFLWIGMRPGRRQENVVWTRIWWTVIIVLVMSVGVMLNELGRRALDEVDIQNFLINRFTNAEVVSLDLENGDDLLEVVLTIRTTEVVTPERVQELKQDLADHLERPTETLLLQIAVQQLVEAASDDRGTIIDRVHDVLPDVTVAELSTRSVNDNTAIRVDLLLRTREPITPEDVETIRNAIQPVYGTTPVQLTVAIQTVIDALPPPPVVTPEPEPDESQ